jgi:hypothetical protein
LLRATVIILLLLFLLGGTYLDAQIPEASTYRYRFIRPIVDTIRFDTIAIVPGTFTMLSLRGDTFPQATYTVVPWEASLILHQGAFNFSDTALLISYRVFPDPVPFSYYDQLLKPERELRHRLDGSYMYSVNEEGRSSDQELFGFGDLRRSGSISRSLSIGNNQDAVLNSTMNLQLSGEIAPGITLVAAITDNTMPIQPDGSSQQLREFDKVYIRVSTDHWEVSAGDIDLKSAPGRFMIYNKRGQGLQYMGNFRAGKERQWLLTTGVSGSVARGRFQTQYFNGQEGNQGPYKLTGSGGEQFIMVLAGSEKVYLDGRLLTRGANNDYVIDYNTAEITFTPVRPVTREMRFMITFEYAERNYNRSMASFSQQASNGTTTFALQYFTEQDIRSQPMAQEQLIAENMNLLQDIGDNLSQAVVPNVKEVAFSNTEVLYKRIDTVVGGTLFGSIYVYSTHPDSARYRVGFTRVGSGQGNYIQTASAANGRVFQWIAPQDGVPMGEFEPVILLVTPKRQQMMTMGASSMLTPNLELFAEWALSVLDINTFSKKDSDDNTGLAFITGFKRKPSNKGSDTSGWFFSAHGLYRYVQQRFSPIERFREVEFERDWNLTGETKGDEHYGKLELGLSGKGGISGAYTFEPLLHGSNDYALRHSLVTKANPGRWKLLASGSYTENMNNYLPAKFLRHQASIQRKTNKYTLSVMQEGEENKQMLPGADTLFGASFAFQRWEAALQNSDSTRIGSSLKVGQRYDHLPKGDNFSLSARADEMWAGLSTRSLTNHQLNINAGYRRLVIDGMNPDTKPEENLLGRGEYVHRLWNGMVRGNIHYEFGSGLEYRKEFSYLEVAPGQGVYSWIDYNGDSIKQLNEFEIAVFQDEANYIRVFTPTSDFERVFTMQYSQSLNIDPAIKANREKRIGRFISRFNSQGNYRVEQKLGGDNILAALNPFIIRFESPTLINLTYTLRNTLFFNRSSSKFGLDYTVSRIVSKMLLVNGFEQRANAMHQLRGRWNITRTIVVRGEGTVGVRDRASEFFQNHDFSIPVKGGLLEIQYQPGTQYRLGGKYAFSNKLNQLAGKEQATLHRISTEFRHSVPMKGSMQVMLEYVSITYNSTGNNPIAFEMLEGLQPGNNFTWTLAYQRTLSNNMQLNVQYNGRKSPETPAVHVGSVQVRAFF